MKMALELLQSAVEPDATQTKADTGMCAQWDVDALKCIAALSSAISQADAGDKPVAYTSEDRMQRLVARPRFAETMWSAALLDDGDIPLYRTPPTHTAAVQSALERAAKVVEAQHPFGQIAVCAAAIRAIKPDDVLEAAVAQLDKQETR
jgi:hypothetical protein